MWIELNASDPAAPVNAVNVHFRTDPAHLGTEDDPVPTSAFVGAATAAQLGVVEPDGTRITVDANGKITVPIATAAVLGLVKVDGTSIVVDVNGVISAGVGTRAYDIPVYCEGSFDPSEVLMEVNVVRAFTLPINLAGSIAKLDQAPTAGISFAIKRNGAAIGSINFAAGATAGTFTFAAAITFAANDVIAIVAPASTDASGLSVTFMGSR